MSLSTTAARRGALALRRAAPMATPVCRFASSHAHDDHHGDHHHDDHHGPVDNNVYPKEGFSSPLWRNVAIVTVVGVAIAKFLPENWREDNFILRAWRMHGYIDPEVWTERNVKHLALTTEAAREKLVFEGQWRPTKKQWSYGGYLDPLSGSANKIPVGSQVFGAPKDS